MNLSNELVYNITSYLKIPEMIKMIYVSKQWSIIIDNELLWHIYCIKLGFKLNKKAKKYKTWKSLIIKNYDNICNNCYMKNEFPYCLDCKKELMSYYITKFELKDDEKENACKSTAMNYYHLNLNDLSLVPNNTVPNPHYRSSSDMILYKRFDLYIAMLKKYGAPDGYDLMIRKKEKLKNDKISKKKGKLLEHDIDIEKYKEYCDKYIANKLSLIKLRNIINVIENRQKVIDEKLRENELDKSLGICQYNKYVKDGLGDINTIIQKLKGRKIRKTAIDTKLQENDLDKTIYIKIYNGYIKEGKRRIDDVINILKGIKDRTNKINFANLVKDDYGTINNYIMKGGDINDVIALYNRKNDLIKELDKHGLKLRNDSVICDNFIRYNDNNIDKVVNIMIEMDWLFTNTDYAYQMMEFHGNAINRSNKAKKQAIKNWYRKNKNIDQLPINIKTILQNIIIQSEKKPKQQKSHEIKCICGNIGSNKCIDCKCKKCCNNTECKRHLLLTIS
jgi:hypothetical protein